MSDRNPCPDCGETVTVEDLESELASLQYQNNMKKIKSQYATATGGVYTTTTPGVAAPPLTWTNSLSSSASSVSYPGYPVTSGDLIYQNGGATSGEITITGPSTSTSWPWGDYTAQHVPPRSGMRAETCTGCGRTYNPYVKSRVADLRADIEAVKSELYHPLELLAMEAED